MIEVGRLCVKLAGRDAGKKAVIIDVLDSKFVLIDGETRRRKCNVSHIEPLNQTVKIHKNASHDEVTKILKEHGIESRSTKPKPKTQRPKKVRKTPEQIRAQKEEKRKLRDVFKPKKKDDKAEAKEPKVEAEVVSEKTEPKTEAKKPKKEPSTKPKAEKKPAAKKAAK